MPRYNIADLPLPPYEYRPSFQNCSFETKFRAKLEDRTRSSLLLTAAKESDDSEQAELFSALSEKLDPDRISGQFPSSLASSRFMREQRQTVIGNLWQAVDRSAQRVSFVTVVPPSWEIVGDNLGLVSAQTFMAQIRTDLNRAGAANADGFLCAGLHGEYDATSDTYQLHVHAVAVGGMIEVCDRLRYQQKYRRTKRVGSPVVLTRKPLTGLPRPLTYCLQSFWPARPRTPRENGTNLRRRDRMRIPDPRHAEFLVWLDRQQLSDTTLLMKIRASKTGLV
jgi:hypothetical protein